MFLFLMYFVLFLLNSLLALSLVLSAAGVLTLGVVTFFEQSFNFENLVLHAIAFVALMTLGIYASKMMIFLSKKVLAHRKEIAN